MYQLAKNPLCSVCLGDRENRIVFFDSDGMFVDDLCLDNYTMEEQPELFKKIIDAINDPEDEATLSLIEMFFIDKIIIRCPTIQKTIETLVQFGREHVNRLGDNLCAEEE